jgi:hypothetical protein
MSDTPETDKNVSVGLENADRECVPVDFCRKLERERDEARAKYDTLVMENMLEVNKLCKERDEAIEKHRFAVIHWQIGVFKMQRERDEAREELRKLKIILDVIKNETL